MPLPAGVPAYLSFTGGFSSGEGPTATVEMDETGPGQPGYPPLHEPHHLPHPRRISPEVLQALQDVERCSGCPSLQSVRQLLDQSASAASEATSLAARALLQLNARAEALHRTDDAARKAKKAKIQLRDVLLWRYYGLQLGPLDAQKLEVELIEVVGGTDHQLRSQIQNAHQKIMRTLLQELLNSDVWRKLVRHMRNSDDDDEDMQQVRSALQWAWASCLEDAEDTGMD